MSLDVCCHAERVDDPDSTYELSRSCGVRVCHVCGEHKGLERCYCGWARDGGDGRRPLLDAGETIDPEE